MKEMKADEIIKEVFDEFDTNVLNIADFDITCGIDQVTHVVLDGDNILAYMANPELGIDFQDDDYEQLIIEDPECEAEIIASIKELL